MNSLPLLRTCFLLLALTSAFNLGRYTIEFSGSVWAWTALVLGVVVLAISLFTVTYEFWKPKS
jgi:hypothetical protein